MAVGIRRCSELHIRPRVDARRALGSKSRSYVRTPDAWRRFMSGTAGLRDAKFGEGGDMRVGKKAQGRGSRPAHSGVSVSSRADKKDAYICIIHSRLVRRDGR